MNKIISLLFLCIWIAHADNTYIKNISLYWAQGVDENLKEIPGSIIKLDLPTEATHLYAVSTFFHFRSLSFENIDNIEFGLTTVVAKHIGMQSHWETDAAFTVQYNRLFPVNNIINLDLAFGIGVSYAFGTPVYEDPIVNDNGSLEYYRFQSYLHFDAEVYNPSIESLHLLFRIHHRSGIYGLIAPPKVGSNFVGIGLVYYFNKDK